MKGYNTIFDNIVGNSQFLFYFWEKVTSNASSARLVGLVGSLRPLISSPFRIIARAFLDSFA